ncbi:MAG: ATP-binding protein [Citrobacter sp.]
MLLNLTIDNWMSYHDEATLSLMSTLERQHLATLAKLPGFRSRKALPVASVYGGNASGKTALFKALACLKSMVVVGSDVDAMVPVEPFLLEKGSILKPTVFDITFLAAETVYRLVIEVTVDSVTYESLSIVKESGEVDVYERSEQLSFGSAVNDRFFKDIERTRFVMQGTRKNQLFLNAAAAQNIVELEAVYRWFSETLVMIGVESHVWTFATCCQERDGFLDYVSGKLAELDTGVTRIGGEQVGVEQVPFKSQSFKRAMAELKPDEVITVVGDRSAGDYGFEMFTVSRDKDELCAEKLRTFHRRLDGSEVSFDLNRESSGTKRLLQLLPMMFDLTGPGNITGERVYVVDELDRCLHTMLTTRLVEDFLATCGPETRKQLLFTTHDLLLMDQSLLRRDEMYIAQRDASGCSELVGLADFEGIRYDKDLVRSYLDGRFGGVPMLGSGESRG